MTEILLTFSGYAWGMLHDLAALKSVPRVKPYLLLMSSLGHVVALYRLMRYSSRFNPPTWLRVICLVLAPLSWAAFFYSIMVQIPFKKAWVDEGHQDELITTGTYALTRHPGVLGITCSLFASAVATRSRRLLFAAPIIALGDVMHVAFQEQAVLPQVFGQAYRDYQRTTPFVIPTARSVRRFLDTIGKPNTPPPADES